MKLEFLLLDETNLFEFFSLPPRTKIPGRIVLHPLNKQQSVDGEESVPLPFIENVKVSS